MVKGESINLSIGSLSETIIQGNLDENSKKNSKDKRPDRSADPPPVPPKTRFHSDNFQPLCQSSFAIYEQNRSDLESSEKLPHERRVNRSTKIETLGLERVSARRLVQPNPVQSPRTSTEVPYVPRMNSTNDDENSMKKRTFPIGTFSMELGALIVVFIVSMVLVLAIRDEDGGFRTTMNLSFCYIYLFSIIWMIWCMIDIRRFRKYWRSLTENVSDHAEYMDLFNQPENDIFYFTDIHSTSGLFMKAGAGILCMGSLLLTVIETAKICASFNEPILVHRSSSPVVHSTAVLVTKIISHILRFFCHFIQFTFLFRYGNLVINRYHTFAQIGLIHIVIANFCTWFDAIVFETLEELHGYDERQQKLSTTPIFDNFTLFSRVQNESKEKSTFEFISDLETSVGAYLYPCLIEYSLISLTVFFIMWRNVGKDQDNIYLRFGDRHIYTLNCSRSSRGLLFGGIVVVSTILTLIPRFSFQSIAHLLTQITELVLMILALIVVLIGFFRTSKLFLDKSAHIDSFDQVLIILTTVGNFAYWLFALFASLLTTSKDSSEKHLLNMEIAIGFIAIVQTFFQSAFILDTLKRRTRTPSEVRRKPGREAVTALLMINLAIWLHDSISAKKVLLNPFQVNYYNAGTWAIIQAFTSPLSIFYRFHSSVCLADIWQEVYHFHRRDSTKNHRNSTSADYERADL